MNRRVQLSLLFEDVDLFEGLVLPWKANRELSPLVIKLLSAYFYSDEIRELVDCFREEEIICEETTSSYEESIANARNTLAFMNMLTEGAKSVLSGGIDEINNIASATGGEPAKETKFGMGLPSFKNVSDIQTTQENAEVPSEVSSDITDQRILNLEEKLSSVLDMVASLNKTVEVLASGSHNVTNEVPKEVNEEVISEPPVNVVTSGQVSTTSAERRVSVELEDLVESIVAESDSTVGNSTSEEVDELVETLVAESAQKSGIEDTEVVNSESVSTDNNDNSLSTDTQKVEETPKLKDGSDSLRAFLSNGVGFSVEF